VYTCFFLFCLQCCRTFPCFSWSLVDVMTRVGSIITKKNLLTLSLFVCAIKCLIWCLIYWFCKYPKINIRRYFTIYIIFNDKIGTDADDTAIVTSRLFRESFNCRYNPRMDYAFCLLTFKSSKKWRSPLFGAYTIFNFHQHKCLSFTAIYIFTLTC